MNNLQESLIIDTNKDLLQGAKRIDVVVNKTTQNLISNMLEQHYQYKNLTSNEEVQIIENLEKLDLDKDWFARGSEGAIFKLEVKEKDGTVKEFVAAKKRYDNEPDDEGAMHHKAEVCTSGKSYSKIMRVPELKAIVSLPNNERFIIMEFIHGKTIYQLQIEKILQRWGVPFGEFKNDSEAEGVFFKELNLNPRLEEDRQKAERRYFQERKQVKLFSNKQGNIYKESMREFLLDIHGNGIYHRDLSNPRNSMITDTGEYVVIDFGKGMDVGNKKVSKELIYIQQEGEMEGVYSYDEEVLGLIHANTKTQEDEEHDQYQQKLKETRRQIEKGDSVSLYVDMNSFSWIKKPEKKQEILEKAKQKSLVSKRIRLGQLEEAKNNEEKYILLLAQSQENIPELQEEITNKKRILKESIAKVVYKKEKIPYATLALGPEKVAAHNQLCTKEIQKYQQEIKKREEVEDILSYLINLQK